MKKDNVLNIVLCPFNDEPIVTHIPNELEPMQQLVGGYIETVSLFTNGKNRKIVLIVDKEGIIKDKPENMSTIAHGIRGNCFFVAAQGEEFVSLDKDEIDFLLHNCQARWQRNKSK